MFNVVTSTVLIVDDLEYNIKLLQEKLLSEYYNIITASDSSSVIDITSKNKVDIILLDIMMPNIDGFEICKRIKENPKTTHIPIIIITALYEVKDRIKCLEAGADEFFTKPFNEVSLFARIKSLTRIKTMIDELELRNNITSEFGADVMKLQEGFLESKILLLDDDLVQAENIKNCLLEISKKIKILTSLEEINNLGTFIPDIIIVNCHVSTMDSLLATAMFRANPILKNSILIMLTYEDSLPTALKAMELGINDYFLYPLNKSELKTRIKTLIKRKHYQDYLQNQLEENIDLSAKDCLTGLFNRRYFDMSVKQLIQKHRNTNKDICMMIFDIDYFKQINDHYGHSSGDVVLKTISSILKSSFRSTDLVTRYGGEEFVTLLVDVRLEKATEIAEEKRKLIEKTKFFIPSLSCHLHISVSIGVAKYEHGDTLENFVNKADKALYRAKKLGRNNTQNFK